MANTNWAVSPPKQAWTAQVGLGFSGVAIRDGRAYTLGNVSNEDTVVCMDVVSGAPVWRFTYPAPARAPGTYGNFAGPRATPTVTADHVYTLSQDGQLKCLSVTNGRPVWEMKITRDMSQRLQEWYGFCSSPVLDKGTIYINHGTHGLRMNAATGELLAPADGKVNGYASPQFLRGTGDPLMILFGWDAVKAVDLSSGTIAWSGPWRTRFDVNAADPVVCPEGVFLTSGYEVGCALLDPDTGKTNWTSKAIRAQCSPVVYKDGYVYGFDEYIDAGPGYLVCVEASSGKEMWRQKGLMGNLIVVDRYLVTVTTGGQLTHVEATPKAYAPVGSVRMLDGTCWIPPSYSNGRVYCRNNRGKLVCYVVGPAN
jgi:outer membrane protein assembly factor BamB